MNNGVEVPPQAVEVEVTEGTRDVYFLLEAATKLDGEEQLNAPADTGDREMKSKRSAAAEEVVVLVKDVIMIEREGKATAGKQKPLGRIFLALLFWC